MNARVNLLEVALKKDIGINLTDEEVVVFSSLDSDTQNDLIELVHSADYIDSIMNIIVHLVKSAKTEDKEIICAKSVDWLEKINTSNEMKLNIKNIIKSC